MRTLSGMLLLSLAAGCTQPSSRAALSPGSADDGDWVPFYARELEAGRLDYFYDRSRLRRDGDRLAARWKILGTSGGESTATLYVIEIDCRRATATERGTVLIDGQGRAREMPRQELTVDRPIAPGTSADLFRRNFCR